MQRHVIYLPGLGDEPTARIQKLALRILQLHGLKIHYVHIKWEDDELFASKLDRIIKVIDSLDNKLNKLSIIGVSAGGSAALNAYSARQHKIERVVFICGMLRGSRGVNPKYYQENPAFKNSLTQAEQVISRLSPDDTAKMLSMRAAHDKVVKAANSQLAGAENLVMFSRGHVASIFVALIFYAGTIAKFIKQA